MASIVFLRDCEWMCVCVRCGVCAVYEVNIMENAVVEIKWKIGECERLGFILLRSLDMCAVVYIVNKSNIVAKVILFEIVCCCQTMEIK